MPNLLCGDLFFCERRVLCDLHVRFLLDRRRFGLHRMRRGITLVGRRSDMRRLLQRVLRSSGIRLLHHLHCGLVRRHRVRVLRHLPGRSVLPRRGGQLF